MLDANFPEKAFPIMNFKPEKVSLISLLKKLVNMMFSFVETFDS